MSRVEIAGYPVQHQHPQIFPLQVLRSYFRQTLKSMIISELVVTVCFWINGISSTD